MKKGNAKAIYLKDYQAPEYLIHSVNLRFDLQDQKTLVYADLEIEQNPQNPSASALTLHGEQLKLLALSIDGTPLSADRYSVGEEILTIPVSAKKFHVQTTVEIDPANNSALEGLYLSSSNYCTQCEAEGFRKITYYLDRPDVLAEFFVRIEADRKRYPILLSNGNKIDQGELEGGRHFVQWHDPYPKPSYLFALVAGDLACQSSSFTTKSGKQVSLEIYTEEHNAHKCDHALASLQKAMLWDEQTYGLEYDLETYMIVAVDDFNMGAMENKGLNIFNSKYVLAIPETATDFDYMGIEAVIAHEYFHNWTGNRVTCRDWFQLSLKEGLTVFRDQEFTSDVTSRPVKRIQDVRNLRTYQFAEDAGPMAHPVRPASFVEINNFYTLTVYEKGAEVVRMYQTLMGKQGFAKGLQNYLKKFDGQAVTTDDFATAMAEANQFELGNFLLWYTQAGTPTLYVQSHWNEATHEYTLSVRQEQAAAMNQIEVQPVLIPLKMSLLNMQGETISLQLKGQAQQDLQSITLHVREEHQDFIFSGITEPVIPSLLQDFSAPVKLQYHYSNQDYIFLMGNDVDLFNRWEAGQQFAQTWLLAAIEAIQKNQSLPELSGYTQALRSILEDQNIEAAFIAEMLILPSELFLAECIQPVDVDAIAQARRALQKIVAQDLEELLFARCQANDCMATYIYNSDDMGKRRLASVALMYLNLLDKNQYIEFAQQQFQQANNMTDKMAVLEAINDSSLDFRTVIMQEFADHWQHEPLVMNKWLSLQARSRREGTVAVVESLLTHPCFSIKNPNNVYSLIGGFASANPTAFHAKDGSGYEFLTQRVIQLNAINPQVAARMVKPLIHWKKYDPQRQALMQASLQKILAVDELSKDVYEIVEKSLHPAK
jgi:aminopeptidase N